MVPDTEGLVPAHGPNELVVGAKTGPHDCVTVGGERESNASGRGVVYADVPFRVAVRGRAGPGEEGQARAGGVKDVGVEVVD